MKIDPPTYRGPHSNGLGYVEYKGKRYYLGKHNSDKSHAAYNAFIEQIAAGGSPNGVKHSGVKIQTLIYRYLTHAKTYYNGGTEYGKIRSAVRPMLAVHGEESIDSFGPLALERLRDFIVDCGLARPYANEILHRLRGMFRWGVSKQIVKPETLLALDAVPTLTLGHTAAREPDPVEPVDDLVVAATLPFMSPVVRAMVRTQRIALMRPKEVCLMQEGELKTGGNIWIYRPAKHKTAWRKKVRIVAIPSSVQPEIQPHLSGDPENYVFSPRIAQKWVQDQRLAIRVAKVTPSQRGYRRRVSKRIKYHYTTDSYRQAIGYAIDAANAAGVKIPYWTPGQLRHTAGTEAEALLGAESARKALGHSSLAATTFYVHQQERDAVDVMRRLERKRPKVVPK